MGSLSRSVKRAKLKLEHERFNKGFADYRRFQKDRLEKGESLEEGEHLLGKKPTFKQYTQKVRQAIAVKKVEAAIKQAEAKAAEEKLDLEWKDE